MNKIENSKLTNEREYYGSELNKTTKIESSIYIGTAIETEESNENNNQQFIKNSLNPNNQPSETPSAPGSK